MNLTHLPHAKTVIGFCIAAIFGYAIFSGWVVFYAKDATMMGDVIGTWKSFAVLAFGFWLGSSSGGKSQPGEPAPHDAGEAARQTANALCVL